MIVDVRYDAVSCWLMKKEYRLFRSFSWVMPQCVSTHSVSLFVIVMAAIEDSDLSWWGRDDIEFIRFVLYRNLLVT